MAEEDLALLGHIQDIEEIEEVLEDNNFHARFHSRDNPFQTLSEEAFIKTFRLSKELAVHVINILEPYIRAQTRGTALDVTTKVLTALRFYGAGSYQMDIGSNINLAISQPSVSRCIKEVSEALNHPNVFGAIVKFPRTYQDLDAVRLGFYRQFNFPGIIGAIDCTHVAIVPPNTNDENYPEHVYVNRKHYHSLNVQLICDHNLRILNVNSRFPGSSHDSYIWQMSNVRNVVENIFRRNHLGYHLIGDSGYPLRPWLITPLEEQPAPDTPEYRFNSAFKTARCTIERCIGVLKARFRCLLKHRVLHYSPRVAAKIVNACSVLHNLCIEYNIPEPIPEEGDNVLDFGILNVPNENVHQDGRRINPDLAEGRRLRQRIIQNHFI